MHALHLGNIWMFMLVQGSCIIFCTYLRKSGWWHALQQCTRPNRCLTLQADDASFSFYMGGCIELHMLLDSCTVSFISWSGKCAKISKETFFCFTVPNIFAVVSLGWSQWSSHAKLNFYDNNSNLYIDSSLQITRLSPICWWLNRRRSMLCLIPLCQTVTSKPSPLFVTWQTENWWSSLDGLNIFQVCAKSILCQYSDFHVIQTMHSMD